jgi:hypothetical protein
MNTKKNSKNLELAKRIKKAVAKKNKIIANDEKVHKRLVR